MHTELSEQQQPRRQTFNKRRLIAYWIITLEKTEELIERQEVILEA